MSINGAKIFNQGVLIDSDCEDKIRQFVNTFKAVSDFPEINIQFLKNGKIYEGLYGVKRTLFLRGYIDKAFRFYRSWSYTKKSAIRLCKNLEARWSFSQIFKQLFFFRHRGLNKEGGFYGKHYSARRLQK